MDYQQDKNPYTIYDNGLWQVFFWVKNIVSLVAYASCIKTCIFVMHPSYYKPYRWFVL